MTQRMPDQTWHEGAGMHLLERQMCKRFTMLNATITLSQAMFNAQGNATTGCSDVRLQLRSHGLHSSGDCPCRLASGRRPQLSLWDWSRLSWSLASHHVARVPPSGLRGQCWGALCAGASR